MSEYWRKGQFQLWNPYAHCGEPQIAIPQPNLFYPPNWTFAFLPFNPAFALNLIGHQFVAGMGNYLLVASLGWGFIPACLAGVVAALSGYMFSLSTNYTLMASAAWLPLIVWSLRSMKTQTRQSLHFAISALSIAMMILTGRPEIFAPALLLLAGYIVFSLEQDFRDDSRQRAVKDAGWQLLAVVLGCLLAAPFIAPGIEWQALSPRSQGLVAKEVLVWSANWYDFLSMLLPQPLGDLFVLGDKFLSFVAGRPGYPPYLIAFVGPVVIALAIFGMFDRSWRTGFLISALLFLFLVLAAGDNLPVAPYLVTNFPKLAILRFPAKLLFFPVWFLSIFAGRGLYLVLSNRVSRLPLIVNFSLWTVLFVIALVLPIYQQTIGIATALSVSAAVIKAQQLICQSLSFMSALGLMLTIAIFLWHFKKIGRNTVSLLVLVTAYALMMVHAFAYSYHGAAGNFFDQGPTYIEKKLTELHEDVGQLASGKARIVTLYFSGLLMPNKLIAGDPDWPASYYQYGRQILTPSTHFDRKFSSSFGYEGAETLDYRRMFVESFNQSHVAAGALAATHQVDRPFYRFCQVTSTKYVLGMIDRVSHGKFVQNAKLDPLYFDLLLEDRIWNIRIYRVNKPLPRVYVSYIWQEAEPNQAVDAITNAATVDFDPWNKTLISKVAPSKDDVKQGNWQAEFLENSANLVRIKVATNIACMLVLTDHFYPGWLATLDGKPTEIYRANGVLRAVSLPAGEHTIEFKYEPDSLKFGYVLSAVAALCLLLAAGLLFTRRRS